MKVIFVLVISCFLIFNCAGNGNSYTKDLTMIPEDQLYEAMLKQADEIVEASGTRMSDRKRVISEDESNYYIKYEINKPMMFGGDIELTFNKTKRKFTKTIFME